MVETVVRQVDRREGINSITVVTAVKIGVGSFRGGRCDGRCGPCSRGIVSSTSPVDAIRLLAGVR